MNSMLRPFSTLSTSFWQLMGLCFFSIPMIPKFWKRFNHTLKATNSKFRWNGQLWTLSPLQVVRTPPWRFSNNLSLLLYLHVGFNFHALNHFIFQFCKAYWINWLSLWGNFGTHLSIGGFFNSPPPFEEFWQGINVFEEDVVYNWTDRSLMTMLKAR
jgi:hypothetical protein